MTDLVCARCGRRVALPARDRTGRICSNCRAITSSEACAGCGQLRRVGGRDREGRPYCERCRLSQRRRANEAAWRQQIVETVVAADSSLTPDRVEAVLATTAGTVRSLRRLAEHLQAHPDVFGAGPTSVIPVLDRFTRALAAAGASRICTIHPVCDACGQRRARHTRNGAGGGICSACSARRHKTACGACGRVRLTFWSDGDHCERLCDGCRAAARRRVRLDGLAAEITGLLRLADPSVSAYQVGLAADRVVPKVPDRACLAEMLDGGLGPQSPARRHPFGARLLACLRAAGADLPGAVCADCAEETDSFFAHGGVIRCAGCERCRQRVRATMTDDDARRKIIAAVLATDGSLPETLVARVIDDTIGDRAALLAVARRVTTDPGLFTAGPTTTAAGVDRFTRGLIAAGAHSVAVIDPVCEACRRRRPRYGRTPTGGVCAACHAKSNKQACGTCGNTRRCCRRDSRGAPVCDSCVRAERRRRLRHDLATQAVASVTGAALSISQATVVAALDRVAPTLTACEQLAGQLHAGPSLAVAGRRPVLVARFLADLRSRGAAIPAAACEDCDGPAEPLRIRRNTVRCETCHTHCPRCGHPRAHPAEGRCRWCATGPPRPSCSQCGKAPRAGLGADGRCRQCTLADRHCTSCGQTHQLTGHPDGWICHRCALRAELDERLGSPSNDSAALSGLRQAILDADNPAGVRRWLRNTTGGQLLSRLASDEVPVTHEALDDASGDGNDRSIGHLRALLVSTGALPDEDRSIDRLERVFERYLEAHIADPADRKTVKAWLRWKTLPRLRKRAANGGSMDHSANNARRALHYVAEMTGTVHDHGRNLANATQADIDRWFSQPGANHWLARPFLTWAHQRGHLPRGLRLPDTPPKQVGHGLDDPKRWEIARRLVNDDTLAVDDRVAAALVVIYAQSVTAVANLAATDIAPGPHGTVTVNLAGTRLPVHQPFAALIGQLPHRRTHGVTDQIDSTWLFPGGHAGKPVRPIVLGQRLRAIGIEPRQMRNTARAQLATEVPPALLGKLIGVSPETATRWANITASDWTSYAGQRANQPAGSTHG